MDDLLDRLRAALAGKYDVEKQIGRGGMATVHRATDVKHDRRVAIKVLHPELAAAIGTERFLREIRIAAGLNHPHILPLYDSGEADGLLFFVMPLAEGESLRDRLQREKQLPVDDALRIAREIADALSYAHAHGIVHRDIKPENVLLEAGHAVVADFGIARAVSAADGGEITQTGMSVGTPAYMSPEQASGRSDVDGRSDLYSLACVLYEMLAGQPPFTGVTTESLIRQHMTAHPPNVTTIRPAVPGGVAAALTRALAKAPADRFNPVALFGEALQKQATSVESMPVPPRTSRRSAWLAVAAVVVAGIVAITAFAKYRAAPTAEGASRRVVAVLPLQNLAADASNAYFAGGLHDEILTQLSKISSLTVISRTSVLGYAGKNTPIKQIAHELGAGSIMEGTVQVVGNRLRVNVQLIDAATDAHLWAESYDRTLDDAFAIQSDVAQKIVAAIGAALPTSEQRALATSPTANPEAYRLYMQGRDYLLRPGRFKRNFEIAETLFERSIAVDPGYALAHAALAEAHGNMFWWRYDPSPARAQRALDEAQIALRLAPDRPESHEAIGLALYRARRDYAGALKEFVIARAGLPNDAALLKNIASVHRRMGRWDEAIESYRKAMQLDPRDVDTLYDLGGTTFLLMRRYADAADAFDRAITLAPDLPAAVVMRGQTDLIRDGNVDAWRAAIERVPRDAQLAQVGSAASQHLEYLLFSRRPDALLRELPAGSVVFEAQRFFYPASLYAGWAHQLRRDPAAARSSFSLALAVAEAELAKLPDDWRVHAARGLALAGLGRRVDALREADWLAQCAVCTGDALHGTMAQEQRGWILAQAGDADAAIDQAGRLLARPALVSAHILRLDPRWDLVRDQPRFRALLAR